MSKKEYPIPEKPKPSPITKANILSKITYSWENPLFKVGYHRPLEKNDLYLLPPKLTEQYNEKIFMINGIKQRPIRVKVRQVY
jgi:hypothetical protein